MDIRFQNPLYLVALPFVVLIAFQVYRRTTNHITPWKITCLVGTGVCLVLAASSPVLTLPGSARHRIVLVDVSDSASVDQQYLSDVLPGITGDLSERDRLSILLFGKNTGWLLKKGSPTRYSNALNRFDRVRDRVNTSGTKPASALRTALTAGRKDESVSTILVSDGQFAGERRNKLQSVADNAGVPVHTVLSREETLRDVRIRSVSSPSYIRSGQSFDVKITLDATAPYSGKLKITRKDEPDPVSTIPFSLREHQQRTYRVNLNPGRTSFHRYRVVIETEQDEWTKKNNAYEFGVRTSGTFRVLWVGSPDLFDRIVPSLREEHIEFHREVRPTETDAYDLFLIAGSSSDVSRQWQKNLSSSVRDRGSGVVMVGTKDTYAVGGWARTDVEKLLPVRVFPPDHFDISVLLDVSGSMNQPPDRNNGNKTSKLTVARDALLHSLRLLHPADRLELISFSNRTSVIRPLRQVGETETLQKQIHRLTAGGGTKLKPALEQALNTLTESKSKNAYVLVYTDGQLSEDRKQLKRLAERADERDIALLVFTTGNRSDQRLLRTLTRNGSNGRVISLDTITSFESALRDELKRIRKFIHPKTAKTNFEGSPSLLSVQPERVPDRTGPYHRVTEKPYAISPLRTSGGEVLVAGWQPGKGRSVAITPLYDKAGALPGSEQSAWIDVLKQGIEWALPNRPSNWSMRTELSGDLLKVYAERTREGNDAQPVKSVTAAGTLKSNTGWKRSGITATPITRNRLLFQAERPPAGAYQFTTTIRYGNDEVQLGMPVNVPIEREYRYPSADRGAMEEIARRTGGETIDPHRDRTGIKRNPNNRQTDRLPLDKYVLLGGAFFLVLILIRA